MYGVGRDCRRIHQPGTLGRLASCASAELALTIAMRLGMPKQRRKHLLQTRDEVVGFPIAFEKSFNRLIFDGDLAPEKFVLALNPLDVCGRDLSRPVGACRTGFLLRNSCVVGWLCRDLSRRVATCRDWSHLLDVGNVLVE